MISSHLLIKTGYNCRASLLIKPRRELLMLLLIMIRQRLVTHRMLLLVRTTSYRTTLLRMPRMLSRRPHSRRIGSDRQHLSSNGKWARPSNGKLSAEAWHDHFLLFVGDAPRGTPILVVERGGLSLLRRNGARLLASAGGNLLACGDLLLALLLGRIHDFTDTY